MLSKSLNHVFKIHHDKSINPASAMPWGWLFHENTEKWFKKQYKRLLNYKDIILLIPYPITFHFSLNKCLHIKFSILWINSKSLITVVARVRVWTNKQLWLFRVQSRNMFFNLHRIAFSIWTFLLPPKRQNVCPKRCYVCINGSIVHNIKVGNGDK